MKQWMSDFRILSEKGIPFVMVTVARVSGSTPREIGAKMFVCGDGSFLGTIGGGALEKEALSEALRCLSNAKSKSVHYPLHASVGQCCGGLVELLYEVVNSGPTLYLFGAGHVGKALCQVLNGTPFQIVLIDDRAEWVHSPDISNEVLRQDQGWKSLIEKTKFDENKTYFAVMTHEHALDLEIIKILLDRPSRFLGLIGSRTKWKSFSHQLLKSGISKELLNRVQCPLGLDLGGKSPQEVAISIAAQLLKIYNGK